MPAGYVPLRAVIQADKGSAYWDSAENTGSFYHECGQIVVSFDDMSILVEDEKVDDVIHTISENSRKRTKMVPSTASFSAGMYAGMPVQVTVGGATIFVMNVERFEKA